ncbi:hypothetical protein [Ferruginibacter sp.]|nr:hypothetical protein [Ferruginibacter sp.]
MKTILIISAFLTFLYSCTDRQKQIKSDNLFDVTYHLLKVDTTIRGTQYHNGYYLLQLNNNNFAVLDTNFIQHKKIEKLLANTKTTFFYKRGDTTILASETKDFRPKEFQLTSDFKLKKLTSRTSYEKPAFYGQVFLEDSTYQIYGCCAGEFGGSLFFYNKNDKRLHFYPSGCVDQVIFYHDSYYVFENLYNANYIRIKYPQELIELKYKDRLFGCNWWPGVDTLKKFYSENLDSTFKGLFKYKSNWRENSLNSFLLNDTLFTIVSADSATYLAMHQGDSLKKVQKLLDQKIWFHHTEYYEDARRRIISFSASSTQWNSDTKAATDMANSGFVIIQGRKIDIAEYQTKRDYIMK